MTETTAKQSAKLLCVDDEPGVLQAFSRLFKDHFIVLTASHAEEALQLANDHPDIAVVLTDYMMPGLSGTELLQKIRTLLPDAARSIISGQIDSKKIAEAINTGLIHKFFLKPWENEHLYLQILEALQMHMSLLERGRLRLQAITDPLTQLHNHRYFQEKLREQCSQACEQGGNVGLIMLDVDHFKSFNDRYGHPEGDRLLLEIADQLRQSCPPPGVVCRYGGEEFAVIYPGLEAQTLFSTAEKIRRHIEKNIFTGPSRSPAYITISLGVASCPQHGKTPSDLIAAADRALYQAKRQGRNQSVLALY